MSDTVEQSGRVAGDDLADIPSFVDARTLDDPFDAYAQLHARCPVYRVPENDTYLITRYDDAKRALGDAATFSSAVYPRSMVDPEMAGAVGAVFHEQGWPRAQTLQRTDRPLHTQYRRIINQMLTRKRVDALQPRIEEVTNELVDAFIDDGECEFVRQFALPLPGIIICEQLGLDASQYPTFKRWADAMLAGANRRLTVEEAVEQAEIEVAAQHHLAAEFEARRPEPRDDVITALVEGERDGEPLTMGELQDLMHQLVTGGFETTTSAIATSMWLLIRYPDQLAKLRADAGLLDNFIDESLRFDSPVAGLWRRATCPVDVEGGHIPEGADVMVRFAAANRDPAKFEQPGEFDIERPNASEHVAFGFGNHFCVGAWLARTELRTAFTVLLDRLDDIQLARPLDDVAHQYSFFLHPLKELPIRFRAR